RLIDRDPLSGASFEVGFGVATSPDGLFLGTGGYALSGNGYNVFTTKSLGLSVPGLVSGAVNTVNNAQRIIA
ncbi:MAG: hypothetical protein ACRDH5_10605, partial [bacterium]